MVHLSVNASLTFLKSNVSSATLRATFAFSLINAVSINLDLVRHLAEFYSFPINVSCNYKMTSNNTALKRLDFTFVLLLAALRTFVDIGTFVVFVTNFRYFNANVIPFNFIFSFCAVLIFQQGYMQLELRRNAFIIIWNWIWKHKDAVENFKLIHPCIFLFAISLYVVLIFPANCVLALNPEWPPQFRFLVYLASAEGYINDGGVVHTAFFVVATWADFLSMFTMVGMASQTFCSLFLFLEVWVNVFDKMMR